MKNLTLGGESVSRATYTPPRRAAWESEATFLNIFGCINHMDLIQSALDRTHLDACFDMLDYMYMRYRKFFRIG